MKHHRDPDDCPADLIPTRANLLGRLTDWEDNESWRDFFETYWRLIYGFALQRGLSHREAQEVVQETAVAVAKSIARFEPVSGTHDSQVYILHDGRGDGVFHGGWHQQLPLPLRR